MNPTPVAGATYEVVVGGELHELPGFVFDGMTMSRAQSTTVLTGPILDQAHLAGIIARVQELGLDLISLCQVNFGRVDEAPGESPEAMEWRGAADLNRQPIPPTPVGLVSSR